MGEYKLYLFHESLERREKVYFELPEKDTVIIGRDFGCSIQVYDNKVSRQHCKLFVSTKKLFVEISDLNTSNGTYVNGKEMKSQLLNPDDTIKIGKSIFKLVAFIKPPEDYPIIHYEHKQTATGLIETQQKETEYYSNKEQRAEEIQDFEGFLQDFGKEIVKSGGTDKKNISTQNAISVVKDKTPAKEKTSYSDLVSLIKIRSTDLNIYKTGEFIGDPLIGETLGNYTIENVIDITPVWRDYRAKHTILPKLYVLRVMSSEHSLTPSFRQRFQRESKLGLRLNHPNILAHSSAGKIDQYYYFAREYIDTVRLDVLVKGHTSLIAPNVVEIGKQVCNALNYAHKNKILHRNINPSNILINHDGNVLLSDFGLSALLDQPQTGQTLNQGLDIINTLFQAPELHDANPNATEKSDIYSLCAVLYYAASGKPPYERLQDTHFGKIKHLAEIIPDISENLAATIHKGLANNPDDRFKDAKSLAAALDKITF